MRSLAVWTTTAAVALLGGVAANAQTTPIAANTQAAPATAATATAAPAAASDDFHSSLAAYASFQTDVSDLRDATLNSAVAQDHLFEKVGHHNRDSLTRGWIAYGASTAAQSPAFVQGVRDAAAYYGRDAVIWAVSVDPSYARGLRGGDEATRMLLDSATADAQRIENVADRYVGLSHTVQSQRWSRAIAPGQVARLSHVRSLGAPDTPTADLPADVTPHLSVAVLSLSPNNDPTAFGGRRFWDAVHGGANTDVVAVSSSVTYKVNPTRGEAFDRMAAVAALQALDAADTSQSAVSRLLADPRSRDCFEMAQLQFYQCVSAAHFQYENTFCLGKHGLGDIGVCIGAVATPDTSAMTPIPSAPATRQ